MISSVEYRMVFTLYLIWKSGIVVCSEILTSVFSFWVVFFRVLNDMIVE